MKKILLAVFALALALGSSMPVYALTQTTTMPVSVTVIPAVAVSATSLNFGNAVQSTYGTASAATITVNASSGTLYTVTLDAGSYFFGGIRHMGSASGPAYDTYNDASYLQLWGDLGFANTFSLGSGVTGTGTGADQMLTVYGLANSGATPGTFSDTMTVTVHY